jgi:hypothetical protein
MTNLDWYARYQMFMPVGQCGNGLFYLAKDKTENAFVVIKQYLLHQPDEAERQLEMFHDEARLYSVLKSKGLIRYFDSVDVDGKLFLAIDPQSACDYMCSHLKPENIERAIEQAS